MNDDAKITTPEIHWGADETIATAENGNFGHGGKPFGEKNEPRLSTGICGRSARGGQESSLGGNGRTSGLGKRSPSQSRLRNVRLVEIIFGITFCGTLAACGGGGGGGGGASPDMAIAATPATPKPVLVSVTGDSTMAGAVLTAPGAYTFTDDPRTDLQTALQAQLGATVTVVANTHGGGQLSDMFAGNGYPLPFQQYLVSTSAAIVTENFAINDRAETTPDNFRAELIQFVTMVRAAGKIPVLEEPNPVCDSTKDPALNVEYTYTDGGTISTFVDVIDSVAAQMQTPLIQQYDTLKSMPNWCSLLSDNWAHPSPALYSIKASNQAKVLEPIIESLE